MGGLGEDIKNLRSNFPELNNDYFLFLKSEDKFHSKFVLIDDKIAWITSCNLLSYSYKELSHYEIICQVNVR